MTRAFVALGANMPFEGVQGAELLARAIAALSEAGLTPRALSGVWQTEAWPRGNGQPDYFNAAIEVDPGDRTPRQLFDLLLDIERRFGRERRERVGWELGRRHPITVPGPCDNSPGVGAVGAARRG